MRNWYTIRAQALGAEVVIYDEIGAYGVSAKGFLAELAALPEATPLALRLNSPGGSVFDAVAIYNALLRHSGTVTVWIDGIAASAASYIAMAGDEIVMPENAFLMIHDPAGLVMGTAEDMRAMAEALDKVKGSLLQGYAAKSGRSQEEIAPLMAAETWLDAKDALDLGLIDRIAEPVRIAARFDVARFRNAPPVLVKGAGDAAEDEPSGTAEADVDPAPAESASDADADGVAGNDVSVHVDPPAAEPDPPRDPGVAPVAPDAASAVAIVDAANIRAEAIAHARVVIDLCRLAGQPQMAGRFLETDTGLDEVRNRLLAAKAEATPDITSSAHAQPGRAGATNPWGEVIARTFKTKG